jgi:hypothetical protein
MLLVCLAKERKPKSCDMPADHTASCVQIPSGIVDEFANG